MNRTAKQLLVGAAIAGILGGGLVSAPALAKGKVKCQGVNSCKGRGHCKATSNECRGKNECKGKGWKKMSEKKCAKKGGTPLPE